MKHVVRNLAAVAVVSLSTFSGASTPAHAYPVDCAILLCLAGGWPASAPCAHARAVFIRRITPWPIEPPLQIWRCPMGVSFENRAPVDRLLRLAGMQEAPHWSSLPEPDAMRLAQAVGPGADIDISGPTFAFIRSINVFDVYLRQGLVGEGEDCRRTARIRHGSYDANGQYHWRDGSSAALPPAFRGDEGFGTTCPSLAVRSVFVEWTDHSGGYGFEQVDY